MFTIAILILSLWMLAVLYLLLVKLIDWLLES